MALNETEKTLGLYERYVMHTYPRADILFVRGQGTKLWDGEGREYLDFAAGIAVCSLGHCHPAVTAAIREQSEKLLHVSNLYMNENQPRLAQRLIENGFDGVCFFCNSGAEANEALIKLARKWGSERGKYEIISMNDSFHGRTLATLAATGRSKYRKGFAPDVQGFRFADFNDIESVKAQYNEHTAAVLIEPVQGEGGIIPADADFIRALRTFCDEKDILLLFDEVQCGMGRTGNLFAWQMYDIQPDALSMAKAIANGIPMGAMICQRKLQDVLVPGTHASTFGGTPFACAAAIAVIDTLLKDGVLENCRQQGQYLLDGLKKLAEKHACIRAVRGVGLMLGAVLDEPAGKLLGILRGKGMLALSAGETVLRLVPPLTVTREECTKALDLIDESMTEYEKTRTRE